MIKLIDLVNGTVRDPFTGDLYEGLIRSLDPHKALDLIQRNNKIVTNGEVSKTGEIELEIAMEYLDDRTKNYTTGPRYNDGFSKLLQYINNVGYYIHGYIENPNSSRSWYSKYTPNAFREYVEEEQPKKIGLMLQAKYGEDVTDKLPSVVYHVTDIKYLSKIKAVGLKPTTQSKRAYHPERVYVALNKDSAVELADSLSKGSKRYEPVMLTLDTSTFPKSLKFYDDPHYTEEGAYTLGNIPPIAITNIEKK